MGILMGIGIWASILASGYVSNADIEEDLKTTFNVAVIIIWVVIFALNLIFGGGKA